VSSTPPSLEDGNRSSFRNVAFFGIPNDGKSTEKFCEFCTIYTIVRILSSLPTLSIIYALLTDAVGNSDCTAPNDWMTKNNEIELAMKEVGAGY
jgi:hypothetical protein